MFVEIVIEGRHFIPAVPKAERKLNEFIEHLAAECETGVLV